MAHIAENLTYGIESMKRNIKIYNAIEFLINT